MCVVVASTKNILSTKSCCSLRATLKRLFEAISYACFDTQLLIVFHDLPFYFWVISNDIVNLVFTSSVSASKEKRRRRTNFRGEERSSPVSPEKKFTIFFNLYCIFCSWMNLVAPCSLVWLGELVECKRRKEEKVEAELPPWPG